MSEQSETLTVSLTGATRGDLVHGLKILLTNCLEKRGHYP